jgi:arginyl-tRNA synthetase
LFFECRLFVVLLAQKMSLWELYSIYTSCNKRSETDADFKKRSLEAFRDLENGDEKIKKIWKAIRETTIQELKTVYTRLGEFHVYWNFKSMDYRQFE